MTMKKRLAFDVDLIEETEIDGSKDMLPAKRIFTNTIAKHRLPFKLPRFPHFEDPNQKKALQYFIRFLALVLVLTIVARGTAGATIPKIETVVPNTQEIIEYVEVIGKVESVTQYQPEVPEGIKIEQILVVPGQTVNVGDLLAVLDGEELELHLSREQIKLRSMELNLQQLQRGQPYSNSALISAQAAYDWAVQDVSSAQSTGQAAIDQAAAQLSQANQEMQIAQTHYDTVMADPNATDEDKSSATEALNAAAAAVSTAESALQTAHNNAATNNQAAARALETARMNLESAQQSDEQARQAIQDTNAQNALDAEALKIDIEEQCELIELYSQYTGGKVLSEISGTVISTASEGVITSGISPLVTISDSSAGFRVSGMVSIENSSSLYSGMTADIRSMSGYQQVTNGETAMLISVSEPVTDTSVRVIFSLPGTNWTQDQNVNLYIMLSRETYEACVPISAIHQSNNGYYIYIVEQSSGVLGTENVVRSTPVELLASNESLAAISGAFPNNAIIVAYSSKPLVSGDKVRVV